MGSRIRFGVIGCGFQGTYHARNVASHPDYVLGACADSEFDRAQLLATETQSSATSDPVEILADPAIDAVIIATTTNQHADLAIEAARNGKHILLEKPMAPTVEECLEIERAVSLAGVTMMIGFKFRFMKAIATARQVIPEPIVLTAHTLYDAGQTTSSWVNNRNLSGGRLFSSLVHSVDLLRYLADAEVNSVTAVGGNLALDGLGDIDNAAITLTFDSGAIASLIHGNAGASPLVSVWSFQSAGIGTNVTIHAHGRRAAVHDVSLESDPVEVVDETTDPFAAGLPELLDGFVKAIERGYATSATPRDGTMAVVVSRAIEAAIASGRPQTVALPTSP